MSTARASSSVAPAAVVSSLFAADAPLFLIAGPCALESRVLALEVAQTMAALCGELGVPYVFKGSYDKANRTSGRGARGPGLRAGLDILAEVRETLGVPVLTDVHAASDAAAVGEVADILQIPAFLCRQTDLIAACAQTGRAMNIKKGQFLPPASMRHVAQKARDAGCAQVMVCERGASFGYGDLVADMRALVWLRDTGCPVVFDATHSAQLPGGGGDVSGGLREMVAPLARAALAVGVNGLFVETHPDPARAVSDAATQIPLADMPALLRQLLAIHRAVEGAIKSADAIPAKLRAAQHVAHVMAEEGVRFRAEELLEGGDFREEIMENLPDGLSEFFASAEALSPVLEWLKNSGHLEKDGDLWRAKDKAFVLDDEMRRLQEARA